jgi:hypothetical protein
MCTPHQIKKNEMDRACSTDREGIGANNVFMGKPEERNQLRRPKHRWEINIKIDFQEVNWWGMDWIDLAQNRKQVTKPRKCRSDTSVSIIFGEFLGWVIIC